MRTVATGGFPASSYPGPECLLLPVRVFARRLDRRAMSYPKRSQNAKAVTAARFATSYRFPCLCQILELAFGAVR